MVPLAIAQVVCESSFCLFARYQESLIKRRRGSLHSQVGVQKYVFTFVLDGEKLTGTAAGERSGDKTSVAIQQGRVTKDGIYFVENLNFQGQDLVIEYTGKMAGDNEISFTRKVGDFATEEIVAKRIQEK